MLEYKICGITFRFTFLFFAVITVFLLMDQSGFAFWGFLAAIIHECGHLMMFILLRNKPKKVVFEVSGIRIEKNSRFVSYHKELLLIVAGPFINLLSAFLLFQFDVNSMFAYIHLGVGLFNLLPIKILDGGQLLQLILTAKYDLSKSERVMLIISFLILIPMLIAGIYIAVFGNHNLTLLITGVYLLISILK